MEFDMYSSKAFQIYCSPISRKSTPNQPNVFCVSLMPKILINGFGIKYEDSTSVRHAMMTAKAVVRPRTSLPITRRRGNWNTVS